MGTLGLKDYQNPAKTTSLSTFKHSLEVTLLLLESSYFVEVGEKPMKSHLDVFFYTKGKFDVEKKIIKIALH